MTAFSELGLNNKLIQNITAKGYDTPSPIQAKAIPLVLSGRDLMAAAHLIKSSLLSMLLMAT